MLSLSAFKNEDKFICLLFSIFPISLILGSAVVNSVILLIDLYFIVEIFYKKKINYFSNRIFYIFILIWTLLLLNSIFIANTLESLIRTGGFLRFILLIFAFKYYFEKNDEYFKKLIFGIWFIVFLIVTIDIYIEFFSGTNILGFKALYPGRIASFTGDELKIGNYYFGFILLSLSFIYFNFHKKNRYVFYISALIFLLTSFIIGERSNFIKVFIIISIFIFLINKQNYFKKISILIVFTMLSSSIIFSNEFFKSRFVEEIFLPLKEKGITKFVAETKHGLHFEIAKNIFKQNTTFGIGIKNFRNESKNIKYHSTRTLDQGIANHPHQIHLEFLSETGLIGYIIFLFFFLYSIFYGLKLFFKNRNIFALSSSLFLFATFLPLLPSGSFFTSYSATIFWINYSFLITKNE